MLRVVGSLRPSLRRSRAGEVAICSGKLSAKAETHKAQQDTRKQHEAKFSGQTLYLVELERARTDLTGEHLQSQQWPRPGHASQQIRYLPEETVECLALMRRKQRGTLV